MANIKSAFGTITAFTLTAASLASSNAGVGRQSTMVDNTTNLFFGALLNLLIKTGTTPTANTLIYVYLIRDNRDTTPLRDDNAGASDAAITIVNAQLIGVLINPSATTGTNLPKILDTGFLGELGPGWGIALVQATQVALSASGHVLDWEGYYKTVN
jgi:hypothetical protein